MKRQRVRQRDRERKKRGARERERKGEKEKERRRERGKEGERERKERKGKRNELKEEASTTKQRLQSSPTRTPMAFFFDKKRTTIDIYILKGELGIE